MGMSVKRGLMWVLCLGGLILPFQNCSKFQSSNPSLALSSQCIAKFRANAASLNLLAADVSCGDFSLYTCDRRIFSPDVASSSQQERDCLSGSVCVQVNVRNYNTAIARTQADAV